jgi:hypothetical protein
MSVEQLEKHYTDLNNHFNVCPSSSDKYKKLVTFNGNKEAPIHRWFNFKEGFSKNLLQNIINDLKINYPIRKFLDPFVGSGTSLLSWSHLYFDKPYTAVGIERNPFIHLVASTKLRWWQYDLDLLERLFNQIISASPEINESDLPVLTTYKNEDYFPKQNLYDLVKLRKSIKQHTHDYPAYKDLFYVALASIVEDVSNLRKDGRMVRYSRKENLPSVYEHFKSKVTEIQDDIYREKSLFDIPLCSTKIINGDSRTISKELKRVHIIPNDFDLILYSPPYLNNFDYTEVYKLELFMTERLTNYRKFKRLRQLTLRSHPSIKYPITTFVANNLPKSHKLLKLLLSCINESDKFKHKKEQIFTGYFDDMYLSLKNQYDILSEDRYAVCVVSNSVHGKNGYYIPVATDLILATIAEEIGFKVEKIQVARMITRRFPHPVNRESILFLKKEAR